MELSTTLKQTQQQKQVLSQKQQYALKILAMSDTQLQKEIEEVIEENPLLEYTNDNLDVDIFEHAAQFVYEQETLKDILYLQLHTIAYSIDHEIAQYFIESLDSNGYISQSVLDESGFDKDTMEDTLAFLQTFEPAGVFARNLQECLLIQLCYEERPHAQTAIMMVNYYMDELAKNQLVEISKYLQVSLLEIQASAALIRSLQPKPGARYAHFSIPTRSDATITIEDDQIQVYMLTNTKHFHIHHRYDQIQDEAALAYIKKAHKQAALFIHYIDKRNITLSAILTHICDVQRGFFLYGEALVPLTLQDVAKQIECHESTISRAISQKYIRFANQSYPIKSFFVNAIEGQSVQRIQRRIRELIQTENKAKPYSDQQLLTLLKGENIMLSRRTIAKYREQMGIISASKRKLKSINN